VTTERTPAELYVGTSGFSYPSWRGPKDGEIGVMLNQLFEKRHLYLTRAGGKPSRFLDELGLRPERAPVDRGDPIFEALRAWRLERAKADGVPAYVVFHDRTLEEIARRRPGSEDELGAVSGIGAAKLERYGSDVLAVLGTHRRPACA